jgi:MoxR-like ATPase
VGKTEVGKVLAAILSTRLIRLQCYEGIDVNHAVYEWNYSRQLLHIRLLEAAHRTEERALKEIFGPDFLVKRPLLQALEPDGAGPPVLLIDEIDRSDDEFEAFLLELLSDFQITIPEIGTLRAEHPPVVVITSNRTREIHDALKRRCLYYWIDYPTPEAERRIIEARVPGVAAHLTAQVVALVQELRQQDLYKLPGVAETLDWTRALVTLGESEITPDSVSATLGSLLKYQEDLRKLRGETLAALVARAREKAAVG